MIPKHPVELVLHFRRCHAEGEDSQDLPELDDALAPHVAAAVPVGHVEDLDQVGEGGLQGVVVTLREDLK